MPTKQCLGLDKELSPMSTIEEPTQSGEERPVAGSQRWTGHVAAQHRYFVTEHDDFDSKLSIVTPEETDQLENSDEC